MKKNTELLKIGILGNENIGKSFLLSRIFKEKDIPYGYSVPTEGLSIKFNKDRMYALFDSAGFQKPIIQKEENNTIYEENDLISSKNKDNEDYLELYKDRIQLENFLGKLIINLSDILIVVVGKITINEQKLINKIKKEIFEQNSKKSIIIIHNLFNYGRKSQVNEYINNILLKSASFKLTKIEDKEKNIVEQSQIFFIEDDYDTSIFHLIVAKELTEAGNYYNNFSFNFIIERFNDFAKRKPVSILEEIKNKFAEWSKDFLEKKIDPKNIIIKSDEKVEKQFIYESPINKDNENENDKKELKIEENINQEIIPKRNITDEYGYTINNFTNTIEPPYTCYIEDNKNLVVKLELFGNGKIEDAYGDLYLNRIIIKGIKEFDNEELKILGNNNNINSSKETKKTEDERIKIFKNTRKFGNFKLVIPFGNKIKLADEDPIDEKEEEKKEEGIKIIKFKLAKMRKRKIEN